MYSSTGTGTPRAGASIFKVAPALRKKKKQWAKKKSSPKPMGTRMPIVHQKARRGMSTPSAGRNQKAITTIGTTNSSRLHVYPCGVGLALDTCSTPGALTVCRVIAAGIAIIASIAATIQALSRGLGPPPDTRAHMKAILLGVRMKFGEFYSLFLGFWIAVFLDRCHRTTTPA